MTVAPAPARRAFLLYDDGGAGPGEAEPLLHDDGGYYYDDNGYYYDYGGYSYDYEYGGGYYYDYGGYSTTATTTTRARPGPTARPGVRPLLVR